ncbi:PA3496 family putative envelope integrity protein [Sulfuriflexus sp.]|uniref:PA3496 family putative envelope integrity protein n=1 Tax=Sulfuriflexus sp. TaxID=2015443 RepID=UPI0028CF23DB|nr:hypothetical protein [Sulfuriflexus sp.]MDT8403703.1 hypothetical protein [Sulfuriflexus sp.]
MAKVDDFEADDLVTDSDIDDDINAAQLTGNSSLEIRRKIEDMLEEKRLRKELEDFYDL